MVEILDNPCLKGWTSDIIGGAIDVGDRIRDPGVIGVVGVMGGLGVVGVVGALEDPDPGLFHAVLRHFVLLFWNQIFIWFSVRDRRSANKCLSLVERY